MVSADPEAAVDVTKKSGGPKFPVYFALSIAGCVMVLGFQNCAVDLLSSTPGASSLGACAAAPAQALTDIAPVITSVIQTNCSACHGVNNGSVKSGFYVPDSTAVASTPAVQSFMYTQLCVRGGKVVGLKIDGSNSHTGGVFSRSGSAAPLYTYLTTYFP